MGFKMAAAAEKLVSRNGLRSLVQFLLELDSGGA